jgi:hypothetical protein
MIFLEISMEISAGSEGSRKPSRFETAKVQPMNGTPERPSRRSQWHGATGLFKRLH